MKIHVSVILAAFVASVVCQKPVAPAWENEWSADFTEKLEFPLRGTHTTHGKWWYSWTQKAFRVDRENGNYDRYCGLTEKFQDIPCTQIVSSGTRYLYFPSKKYCCNCCSAEHGCGIVKPTWTTTGLYRFTHTDAKGVKFNEFDVKGNQSNFYDVTVTDNKPYRLFQDPLSDMLWDVNTYSTSPIPSTVFDLPSKDCKKYCPFFSICTEIRNGIFAPKPETD